MLWTLRNQSSSQSTGLEILPHQKFLDTVDFIRFHMKSKGDGWTIIITGDFNFPNICWDTLSIKTDSHGSTSCAETLLQFMESEFLTQVVEEPTRKEGEETENILDLIITNNTGIIKEVEINETTLSDHDLVSVVLSETFNPRSKKKIHF